MSHSLAVLAEVEEKVEALHEAQVGKGSSKLLALKIMLLLCMHICVYVIIYVHAPYSLIVTST